MDKNQLLQLEKNSDLSIAELHKTQPELATPVEESLEKRVTRTAVAPLAGRSEKLRKVRRLHEASAWRLLLTRRMKGIDL